MSTVSRYQANVRHLAGAANLPSDFASRNAPDCENDACQICSFINKTENSVIRQINVTDILNGSTPVPFASRSAWFQTQMECSDLRRVHAHLTQGTRPSKKATKMKDIKRYLQVATISKDGLLVVKRGEPLARCRDSIIVPRQVLDGLLSAMHIKLGHPTRNQLRLTAQRVFYALDMEKALMRVTDLCHLCASLKTVPHSLQEQSTGDPPEHPGVSFAADVIKRSRQSILVLRETVTAFTRTCFLVDEKSDTLRCNLICLCVELCPIDAPSCVVRVDGAPGFRSLVNDSTLRSHNITLEVGRAKNINRNPVAEHAVQELERELIRVEPGGGPVSCVQLAVATSRLNARIRSRGLSSREMWMQRDQYTNEQIPVSDRALITQQHLSRQTNHPQSSWSKAKGHGFSSQQPIDVGDLVYLKSERDKHRARDRYIVVSIDGDWCNIRKFTGSQLRSSSYKVKLNECYTIPHHIQVQPQQAGCAELDDVDDELLPLSDVTEGFAVDPPTSPSRAHGTSPPDVLTMPTDHHEHSANGDMEQGVDHETTDFLPRRSTRIRKPPAYLKDYQL